MIAPIITAIMPDWVRADLVASGISPELAAELGIRPVTPAEYSTVLGFNLPDAPRAYEIPFTDPEDQQPMLTPDGRKFLRFKLERPVVLTGQNGNESKAKYLSPRNGGQHAYIPAETHNALTWGVTAVTLTEGERKAICATLHGLPTIGLIGAWGWKAPSGDLLPELKRYARDGETWTVIFDSDASNNPDFSDATRSFATALNQYGVKLQLVVLPRLGELKTGLDDYLLHEAGGMERLHNEITNHARIIEGGSRFVAKEIDPWGTPQPLSDAALSVEPWPWAALPAALRAMGEAVVHTIGVEDALVGLPLLCILTTAVGKALKAKIKAGHEQFANLFGLVVSPPASKKTPVFNALQAPLVEIERELRMDFQQQHQKWELAAEVAKLRLNEIRKKLAQENDPAAQDAAQKQAEELQKVITAEPMEPRLFCDDVTSEALARRMEGTGGCGAVLSSDGRKAVAVVGGKYTEKNPDIDLYLKGHSGHDPIRVDRANKDKAPIVINNGVLTLCLAVQPDILVQLGQNIALTSSGFLGRFLYATTIETNLDYPIESIPSVVAQNYAQTVRALYALRARYREEPLVLPLTPRAFERWCAYHTERGVEIQRRRREQPSPNVEHYLGKEAEHVVRVALLLRALRHVSTEQAPLDAVGEEDIVAALAIVTCLRSHALRAFGAMGSSPLVTKAQALWIMLEGRRAELAQWRQHDLGEALVGVKPRDAARYGWAGINSTEEAEKVLDLLATKGWMRRIELPAKGARARPHVVFELHPNPPAMAGQPARACGAAIPQPAAA